jgi:hypothetical protein
MVVPSVLTRGAGLSRTHASGRWLGTKQAGVCAVGDMSGSEGGNARSHGGGLSEDVDTRTIGNSETPPCSAWLIERENAEGEKAPTERRPPNGGRAK